MRQQFIVVGVIACLQAASLIAQNQSATIRVQVRTEGKPVEMAEVLAAGTVRHTNASGTAEIVVPAGEVDLTVLKNGYVTATVKLTVTAGARQDVTIDLPPEPTIEETVTVVATTRTNKRLEDHVKLAEHYKRYVDAECRFIFVGRYDLVPRYHAMVRALIVRYRMLPDRFIFTGPVPDEDLATYYRMADAYVSLSEHEGFCVPLIEAMAADVPVLAYASTVIPETLAGAGVQFSPKDLEYVAELLGVLVYDDAVRERVIDGQRRRVKEFGPERIEREVDLLLSKIG